MKNEKEELYKFCKYLMNRGLFPEGKNIEKLVEVYIENGNNN